MSFLKHQLEVTRRWGVWLPGAQIPSSPPYYQFLNNNLFSWNWGRWRRVVVSRTGRAAPPLPALHPPLAAASAPYSRPVCIHRSCACAPGPATSLEKKDTSKAASHTKPLYVGQNPRPFHMFAAEKNRKPNPVTVLMSFCHFRSVAE